MADRVDALIAEARARTTAHARQNPEGSVDLAHRLADEVERLRIYLATETERLGTVLAQRDRLRAAVNAVRAVHWQDFSIDTPPIPFCNECQRAQMNGPWPCPTVAALDEDLGGHRG